MRSAYAGTDVLEMMREATNYNSFLRSLVDAQISGHDKVIDFGAGAGTFALPLVRRGVDVICVEPDDRLRENLMRANAPAVASLDEIEPCSADVIFCLNVLEHVEDDRKALQALAEKLKFGGRLLLYVPAFPILHSAFDRRIGHLRRYRRPLLRSLLTAAGFEVRRAVYVDSIGFVVALAYRVVGDGNGDISPTALKLYDRFVFGLSRVIDVLFQRWVGKNLLFLAERAERSH
jgi:SAM-dependent methyltransferase